MNSKTFSIAIIIGTSRAQAIRRSVRDDFKLNSGVYAMGISPPFKRKKPLTGDGKWFLFKTAFFGFRLFHLNTA